MTIRVLLADDQALMRSGFRMILDAEDDIQVVAEAADGREAVAAVAAHRPDLVVMDVRMPHLDGVAATARIAGPGVPDPARVLVLTTFDLDEYVYGALRAGAAGFLLKTASPEDLIHAVRVIAAGEALLSPSVTARLIAEFARRPDPHAPPPRAPSRLDQLTPREREVLVLIARGRSNAEIAAALFLSDATVKTHVGHVLTKLGVRDRVQAVVLVYEHGLIRPSTA